MNLPYLESDYLFANAASSTLISSISSQARAERGLS